MKRPNSLVKHSEFAISGGWRAPIHPNRSPTTNSYTEFRLPVVYEISYTNCWETKFRHTKFRLDEFQFVIRNFVSSQIRIRILQIRIRNFVSRAISSYEISSQNQFVIRNFVSRALRRISYTKFRIRIAISIRIFVNSYTEFGMPENSSTNFRRGGDTF